MERKRKLPARAAARVENEAKRRNSTPREAPREAPREPSEEPAPPPAVEEPPPPPPPLPRSVQAGKPLPTVEDAQPDDLSTKEYQSVGESGVLAESLIRSRHKWINEGLFQKYWAKPHKRKGVVHEEPNNPPKHLMSKVGTVTITIEPHIIDATMYIVTDPDRAQGKQIKSLQTNQSQNRPIIQYGPPNGTMPPPVPPKSATASPTPDPAPSNPTATNSTQNQTPAAGAPSNDANNKASATPQPAAAQPVRATASPAPSPSYPPRPPSVPASSTQTPPPPPPPPPAPAAASTGASSSASARQPSNPPAGQAAPAKPATPAASAAPPPGSAPQATGQTNTPQAGAVKPATTTSGPSASPATTKAATNDPVIALLAQKASGDAELRDLMKRVAVGQAKQHELNHFQSIINQLNAEYKRGGGQQGPSADRLLVDGRTVRYFADEVCAILDIVLASNPNQRAVDLRPPPRSDPLVVLVVKTALEDKRTKDMCRRIATGKPGYTDATDLKEILDRLHRDSKIAKPNPSQWTKNESAARPNPPNGVGPPIGQKAAPLRTKGHVPTPRPDVTAVVFDFGTGDRYLFPKFSILEFLPTNSGQLALASFLIVRKGSTSEYGGNPDLDYYQPVTMKLYTPNGRHLENLAKVVAQQDEVRRYMDDVMDNMTRAEYILLAMRLPRAPKDETEAAVGRVIEESKTARSTPQADKDKEKEKDKPPEPPPATKPPVLWMTNPGGPKASAQAPRSITSREAEEETQAQYLRLINSVAAKESAAT